MDNETLQQIFSDAGEEYGLVNVKAEFTAFKEMKVRWTRTICNIDLRVTDYLKEAPEEIIRGFAEHLMAKIFKEPDIEYPEDFVEWLTSDRFRILNRDTYLQRSNALPTEYRSTFHDLEGTYKGLISKGLLKEIPDLSLRWTAGRCKNPMGASSVLMRSVIVPTYLDTEDLSDKAFEFNLYRLMTNLVIDFGTDPAERRKIAESMLESYPESKELSDILENQVHLASCEVD